METTPETRHNLELSVLKKPHIAELVLNERFRKGRLRFCWNRQHRKVCRNKLIGLGQLQLGKRGDDAFRAIRASGQKLRIEARNAVTNAIMLFRQRKLVYRERRRCQRHVAQLGSQQMHHFRDSLCIEQLHHTIAVQVVCSLFHAKP